MPGLKLVYMTIDLNIRNPLMEDRIEINMESVTSPFFLIQYNKNFDLFHLGNVRIYQAALCHDDSHTKSYKRYKYPCSRNFCYL